MILTGAALEGASRRSAFLLLAYAAGAATSLAVALLAGGRVFAALKRSLGAEVWIRSILGVAVLAGVAVIAFGLDRGLLTRVSLREHIRDWNNPCSTVFIPTSSRTPQKDPKAAGR